MHLTEALFLFVSSILLLTVLAGKVRGVVAPSPLIWAGFFILLIGIVLGIYRWQLIPALVSFVILVFSTLKRTPFKLPGRILLGVPILVLLGLSVILTYLMPILSLPVPEGPYAIGTFDYTITDETRREVYAPENSRELFVQVWYPANKGEAPSYPVRSYAKELYSGNFDFVSILTGYFSKVPTHSHLLAPIADTSESFPVLLYNHGGDGYTDMNSVLIEHLSSHGYVVISIAHPYDTLKVNLPHTGTILEAFQPPIGSGLTEELFIGINAISRAMGQLGENSSSVSEVLNTLIDEISTLSDEQNRNDAMERAINHETLQLLGDTLTVENLSAYVRYSEGYLRPNYDVWVRDTQFIANTFYDTVLPVEGLHQITDRRGFGVFGLSRGGVVATEFCKTDPRCLAGANMDGNPRARNWNSPLNVPFLLLTSEENQGQFDFSYLQANVDFVDYSVAGTEHIDFTDIAFLAEPLASQLNLKGSIDGARMLSIVNALHLAFFDTYLKNGISLENVNRDFPELVGR